jgi:hypothetical protein
MRSARTIGLTSALALLSGPGTGCLDAPAGHTRADGSAARLFIPAPPPSPPAPPPAPSALPPLGGEWLVTLPLEGFGAAVVSVPLGASEPRSIVVGVHGRGDRPEWACGEWRPFILCPHGTPVNASPGQGLAFQGAERTLREIDAGLAALKARFGRHVAEGPMIYAGFSLGAFLGVHIVAGDPARFPIAVLGEGGYTWTADHAARFARGGGKRVLFVCSTGACNASTSPSVALLRRAGVEARMVSAGNIGHLVDDRIVQRIRAEWPWVLGGDGERAAD